MVTPTRPPKNSFNATMRKVYNPLGFSKAYNFVLWFIFAGALTGFCLARFMFLNYSKNFCPSSGPSPGGNSAAPGECYYYETFTRFKIGILLHLAGILPAGLLAVFQFTPFIRHKWIIVHKVCGYAALSLWIIGTVGAFLIARHAFGGELSTQVWVGAVGGGSTICFVLAYINIKRLQIEQHRAWMLRGWFYAGSIITSRLIMFIAINIVSSIGSFYTTWPCAKIAYVMRDNAQTVESFPECKSYFDGTNTGKFAVVHASTTAEGPTSGVAIGAALNVSFGMALWLALAIHAVGVEVYLHLTPREAERLRNVSYQRQLEAGMKKPGSAGLTADKLGDSEPWAPEPRKKSGGSLSDDQFMLPSTQNPLGA